MSRIETNKTAEPPTSRPTIIEAALLLIDAVFRVCLARMEPERNPRAKDGALALTISMACKRVSVGRETFRTWRKLGLIHPLDLPGPELFALADLDKLVRKAKRKP